MRVLSLCDKTGNMLRPWADAGHDCTIVDIQHPDGITYQDGIRLVGSDIRKFNADGHYDLVFCWPPCTHLASSGSRWWAQKGLGALVDGLSLVTECLRIIDQSGAWGWTIENPVGRLSTCWREPDYTFDPCEYGGYLTPPGDHYTKRTCLWVGGSFIMPSPRSVPPLEGSKMHLVPPGPNRQNIRSATPMGFAHAVFESNRNIASPLFVTEAI